MSSSLPPGMPERGGFADRLQQIDRRLAALERSSKPAVAVDFVAGQAANVSLTTAWLTVVTNTFTIPQWAEGGWILSAAWYGQISASETHNLGLAFTVNDASDPAGTGAEQTGVSGETHGVNLPLTYQDLTGSIAGPGDTITLRLWAKLNASTNSSNGFNAAGTVLYLPWAA